jgi:hypothetical protein
MLADLADISALSRFKARVSKHRAKALFMRRRSKYPFWLVGELTPSESEEVRHHHHANHIESLSPHGAFRMSNAYFAKEEGEPYGTFKCAYCGNSVFPDMSKCPHCDRGVPI